MKKTIEENLAALCEIHNRYQECIDADPILKRDFDVLMECFESSETMALQHYQKIMDHLIAESDEAVEDNQRMADESPTTLPVNSDAHKHLQARRDLKSALDEYQANYLPK